ncbi:30S ribosomal protein S16, partial [Xanthomonas perforans]
MASPPEPAIIAGLPRHSGDWATQENNTMV